MLKSATKLALILLIGVLCLSVVGVVIFNITAEPVVTGIITLFGATVGAVVGYYFKNSTTTSTTENNL